MIFRPWLSWLLIRQYKGTCPGFTTGNGAKFALGNVSMAFDLMFPVQYYVLYRLRRPGKASPLDAEARSLEEEDPLLEGGWWWWW